MNNVRKDRKRDNFSRPNQINSEHGLDFHNHVHEVCCRVGGSFLAKKLMCHFISRNATLNHNGDFGNARLFSAVFGSFTFSDVLIAGSPLYLFSYWSVADYEQQVWGVSCKSSSLSGVRATVDGDSFQYSESKMSDSESEKWVTLTSDVTRQWVSDDRSIQIDFSVFSDTLNTQVNRLNVLIDP